MGLLWRLYRGGGTCCIKVILKEKSDTLSLKKTTKNGVMVHRNLWILKYLHFDFLVQYCHVPVLWSLSGPDYWLLMRCTCVHLTAQSIRGWRPQCKIDWVLLFWDFWACYFETACLKLLVVLVDVWVWFVIVGFRWSASFFTALLKKTAQATVGIETAGNWLTGWSYTGVCFFWTHL